MPRRDKSEIPYGTRFVELEKQTVVWVVQRAINDFSGNPHVIIAREDDPTWTVIIAVSELRNRTRFRRLETPG